MSSGAVAKSGTPSRLGAGPLPNVPSSSQNHLLDKVNARTSTPDSEALASSEDEGDHRQDLSQAASQPPKPVRRSSWLNDTSHPFRPRKGSFASGSMSPTTSHPSTPAAETTTGPWSSQPTIPSMPRPPPTGFAWGAGIWNHDRKDGPLRLSEMVPSPTSTVPPGHHSYFGSVTEGGVQTSPSREPGTNTQIPFAIPLHPTPKAYRSQSYSVGQMELESASAAAMGSPNVVGRARYPALQHRPSRPSMLSEMASDSSMLGKVKEVDDDEDEDSLPDSIPGSFAHQTSESKTIEMLTRENAMLRQQQQYNARMRPRASTGTSAYFSNGYSLRGAVPEESDYAIDELDEMNEMNEPGESFARRAASRRMSEFGSGSLRSPLGMENRKADNANLKKALWSSSGFQLPDVSQSRRHSFANMPTRQGSISSIADSVAALDATTPDGQSMQDYVSGATFADSPSYITGGSSTSSYMPGNHMIGAAMPNAYHNPFQMPYGSQPSFGNRAPSPHRSMHSLAQPRHNQLLHIVLFKCARADVFYIQEGTGLTVKPGDLVIVEADRGTDLGTVAKDNVDWQAAKELKEHYAEEHYKWLMMYSQGAAAAQEGSGAGLMASSNGLQGSAVGGMGPPTQHHMQEPNAGELRPKLIKRLAQSHEVHSLRDKEGQEAKAKRVCMQKVKEHGLSMEILDAEFQMDWKKLTFYYFADAYINFNSLVTDLFKIYKTRIWMSAINPASFASPTLGIQAPSGVGPGAVGVNRSANGNERRQNTQQQDHQQQQQQQQQQQPPPQASFAMRTQAAARGFQPSVIGSSYTSDKNAMPAQMFPGSAYGYGQPGNIGVNPSMSPFGQGMGTGIEGISNVGYQQLGDFQQMRHHRFGSPQSASSPNPRSQAVSPLTQQNDWAAFQGLSLNTQ